MLSHSVHVPQSDGVRILKADKTADLRDIYPPLAEGSKQFRLLDVQPGKSADTLRCDLRLSDLSDSAESTSKTTYATVSYCWEDPTLRDRIVLNGHTVDVPTASAAALRRVRLPDVQRTVWIDAVCINQGSNQERSQQVAMMGSIYRNGQENLIYMGEGDFEQAIQVAKELLDHVAQLYSSFRGFLGHSISQDSYMDVSMDTLPILRLYTSPWVSFISRVWTFQEAVLSKRNICLYGSSQIQLLDILQSWVVLMASNNLQPLGQEAIVTTYQQIFGMFHFIAPPEMLEGLSHGDAHNLLNLVDYVRSRHATDLRDHVYGVLGLANDASMIVDYNKDVSQVFKEAAASIVEEGTSLEMLRFAGCFRDDILNRLVMPSWVPQWHSQNFPFQLELKCDTFSADGGRRMVTGPAMYADDAGNVLRARGIRVGLVLVVHVTRPNADVHELRQFSLSHGAETLARVLTCAGSKYEHILEESSAYMQTEKQNLSEEAVRLAGEFYAKIVSDRHKIFTAREGHLGMGSDLVESGDIVCIIYGLSWPAILRPVGNRYRFIGVAYVDYMMNGEAVEAHDRSGENDTVFEIC